MENIFENAKFGDKFKTRDGRMAIFFCTHTDGNRYDLAHPYDCIIDGFDLPLHFYPNGQLYLGNNFKVDEDIISRWDEPIDEERIYSLAEEYCIEEQGELYSTYLDGFISGYRKAKQE